MVITIANFVIELCNRLLEATLQYMRVLQKDRTRLGAVILEMRACMQRLALRGSLAPRNLDMYVVRSVQTKACNVFAHSICVEEYSV